MNYLPVPIAPAPAPAPALAPTSAALAPAPTKLPESDQPKGTSLGSSLDSNGGTVGIGIALAEKEQENNSGNSDEWKPQEVAALLAALENYPDSLGKKKRFFHIKRAVGNGRSSNECYKYWKKHYST